MTMSSMDLGEHDEPDYTLINQGGPLGSSDLDQIDLQSLSPAILSALQQLDPERQRRALEMLLAEQQAEEDQIMQQLPDEHFLTIALNGMILGATEMATGFHPGSLLMTSAFDTVHPDDILGLHTVKTHFWEHNQPDVEVYLRRQNTRNEWIWFRCKVVSYIDSPVPGIILQERKVDLEIEEVAYLVSRVTRIASLLLQAVTSTYFIDNNMENKEQNCNAHQGSDTNNTDISGASEIQAMLMVEAEKMGIDLSITNHPLQELMKIPFPTHMEEGNLTLNDSCNLGDATRITRKKDADLLDYLKSGACLNLSKIPLAEGEIKLVALVLTGRLQVEDLGSFIYLTLNSPGMDLVAATDEFYSLSEQQMYTQHAATAFKSQDIVQHVPPPLSVINLSYTDIGNEGMKALSEFIFCDNPHLKTLDLSFCGISSYGMLELCRGLGLRYSRGLPALQALLLSGNTLRSDVASKLGKAISCPPAQHEIKRDEEGKKVSRGKDEIADVFTKAQYISTTTNSSFSEGIKLLYIGSTSITPESLVELLGALGPECPLQELKIQSNKLGSRGASILFDFLESKSAGGQVVLPKLNRLDISFNELGESGIAKLTRAISKRSKINMLDVSISGNEIRTKGIESIMNKLLQHRLVTLNLDNNSIGDQGCQLVAASLPSISTLSRLNMSFNDIGCRGISTLMRSLVGCESITSLGLSGNTVRIAGAISMGFALAQHPRLSILELDNCCLSQVAQCHIVAGIVSNRWVPMKVIHGFRVGPPMVAIGALEGMAQHLSNQECFRLRRDIQMKTMLQWMENNRTTSGVDPNLLTNDMISGANDLTGAPSQSAYLRMLDWLGRIPFDSDELMDLRKYFYDVGGGDEGQKSERSLKHRGDLLAALAGDDVEKILEENPLVYSYDDSSVGLDLNKSVGSCTKLDDKSKESSSLLHHDDLEQETRDNGTMPGIKNCGNKKSDCSISCPRNSISSLCMSTSIERTQSHHISRTLDNSKTDVQYNARIIMFPEFATKLENLKSVAQEMMDNEPDPVQQDVIAQQFVEASLTILRQLRYHCMENGLDGWRQGRLRRKVLIVDDSIVTRKLVARAFEKVNFIVDTAENGVEGVNKMKESIYDIAFMDIDMPVMNGFDATKALRMWEDTVRPGARQPICALTAAHVDDFDRNELMKFRDAGLNVMESKPCNIPRLFKVVDDVSPMFSDLSISASHFLDQNQQNHDQHRILFEPQS